MIFIYNLRLALPDSNHTGSDPADLGSNPSVPEVVFFALVSVGLIDRALLLAKWAVPSMIELIEPIPFGNSLWRSKKAIAI